MKYRVRYNQGQYTDGSGRVTSKSAIVDAADVESARQKIRETKPRVGLVFDAEPVYRFRVVYLTGLPYAKYGAFGRRHTVTFYAESAVAAREICRDRHPAATSFESIINEEL
jgi:hypothetical protein